MLGQPDPLGATTAGTGELIAAALGHGAEQIMLGVGGSASTDGGCGALAALGAVFRDARGAVLPPGGGALRALASVDLSGLRPPPPGGVTVLTDVTAPLLGPDGAAAVFGPQKGAGPAEIAMLEEGLARLAGLLGGDPAAPGAGAAGGTGYGFAAAWGAVHRARRGRARPDRRASRRGGRRRAGRHRRGPVRRHLADRQGDRQRAGRRGRGRDAVRAGRRGHRGAAAARLPGRDRAGRAGRRRRPARRRPGPLAGRGRCCCSPLAAGRCERLLARRPGVGPGAAAEH